MVRLAVAACLLPSIVMAAPDAREALEQAADEIRWLSIGWIVYDRDQAIGVGPREAGTSILAIQGVMHAGHTVDELRPLLDHEDPKVRTLAIIALAYLDYPRQLDSISSLLADEDETFPAPGLISAVLRPEGPPDPWPEQSQTVGDVARGIIIHHLRSAGIVLGGSPDGNTVKARWDQYWARRREQQYGLADYIVLSGRASTATMPLPPGREEKIRRVADDIRRLPMPDRFLVLHAIRVGDFSGGDHVATEGELLALARQLTRTQRLALVSGEQLVEDVDRPQGVSAWSFIMRHAAELLEPEDAEMLLEREREARLKNRTWRVPMGTYSPEAAIAAAELRPDKARDILYAAFGRFTDYNNGYRRELGAALFRLGTDADLPYLVHLFYSMHPEQSIPGDRALFLTACRDLNPQRYARMVSMIVYDLRFSGLGAYPLRELAKDVGKWTGREIITPEEAPSLRAHDESGEHSRLLSEWRRRIRAAVDHSDRMRLDWELEFETGL